MHVSKLLVLSDHQSRIELAKEQATGTDFGGSPNDNENYQLREDLNNFNLYAHQQGTDRSYRHDDSPGLHENSAPSLIHGQRSIPNSE
jgi:hypothetical protein